MENKKNDSISIFIGSTTGVIVALEKGLKILHICFDPVFDSYSEFLWPNLKVEKITENRIIFFSIIVDCNLGITLIQILQLYE